MGNKEWPPATLVEKGKEKGVKLLRATLIAALMNVSVAGFSQQGSKQELNKDFPGLDISPDKENGEKSQKDKKVTNEYIKKFQQNKHEYVRDAKDIEIVISESLSALRGKFPRVEDLRNSVLGEYGYTLEGQDMLDLYSFIETGHSTNIDKSKDVERLQEILNKISASAEVSDPNAKLNEILESNSKKPEGVDNKLGIATQEALERLALKLSKNLQELDPKPVSFEKVKDTVDMRPREVIEMKMPEMERGKVGITFEAGTPSWESINTLFTKLYFNPENLENFGKYLWEIETSEFDTVKINGVDRPWGDLNDLGVGKYEVKGADWTTNFEYIAGTEGPKSKIIKDFVTVNEKEKIAFSCDVAWRGLNNEKGESAFGMAGARLTFGQSEMGIGEVFQYDTQEEIGGKMNGFYLNTGGWSFTADSLSVSYQKENGEWDLQKILDNISDGNGEVEINKLLKNVDFGGVFDLRNQDGSVHISCDGESVFYNNGEIYRTSEGYFGIRYSGGNGAVYDWGEGISSYVIIKGGPESANNKPEDKMTGEEFIDRLIDNPEMMLGSKENEFGISLLGDVIDIKIDASSNITKETFENSKVEIQALYDKYMEEVRNFGKEVEQGSTEDYISKFFDFRARLLGEAEDLINKILKDNDVQLENWEISVDFKKLSDNFELTGDQGKKNDMYSTDVFFRALGNDLGKITISKAILEAYNNAENKEDFVVKQLGWGENLDEVKQNFINNAVAELGADIMKMPVREILNAIDAVNNGLVAGITLNGSGQVSAFVSLIQKVEKLQDTRGVNLIFTAHTQVGDGGGEGGFIQALDKPGKEHLGLGYDKLKNEAGMALIITKVITTDGEGSSTTIFSSVGAEKVSLDKINISYSDGKGNIYNLTSVESAIKMLQTGRGLETMDPTETLELIKSGVPVPYVSLGIDWSKRFQNDVKASFSGSVSHIPVWIAMPEIPVSKSIFLNAQASIEKDIITKSGPFSKITLGAKVNYDKQQGQGFINQFSGRFSIQGQLKSPKTIKMENYQKDSQGNPIGKAHR